MKRRPLTGGALLCACLVWACSGDGGGSGATTARSWDQLVSARGTPTLFNVECSRLAFDPSTGMWEPQEGFVRVDLWIYAGSENAVFTLVNGEVISSTTSSDDLSDYPNPGLDPRQLGCGEERPTVESVLGGTMLLTTAGSDVAGLLSLGQVQLVVNYYSVNSGASGVQVTYANGKMVGMVTL